MANVTSPSAANVESIPESAPRVNSSFREIEAQPINSDVENALFQHTSPARTFLCRSVFNYDVPEVKNLEAEFVYNFFTRDERVRKFISPEEQLVNIDAENTSDILYQVKNDKIPRYVRFSFQPAKDPHAKPLFNNHTIIRDNVDKIIVEGAGSSKYHTGVELLDTNLEKSIYSFLSGSFTFISSITEKDSPASAGGKLDAALSENGGLTGQSKKVILEALSTIQAEGYSFAPSDVSPEVAQTANDPLAKQTFSLKFNNLFFADIINSATRIPDKVFQDEIETLKDISEEVQGGVIIDATKINEAEFENKVQAITSRPFDNTSDLDMLLAVNNHEISQIGYIIQRMEILPNESAVMLEPLFSDNPGESLYVIDKNVRYGGVYVYKVRTVCKVKSIMRDLDNTSSDLDQQSVVEFLMASEGETISVSCTESTPPPPPTRLRARLEPRLKKPVLNWQFPMNPQRDIKRFQIFKRDSINVPFTLVCEYDFDDSMIRTAPVEIANEKVIYSFNHPRLDYLDNNYELGESPIYAIASVDAHGYSSHLSAQIQVTYDRFKNKIKTKVISGEGAPKPYPNLLLEDDAFDDAIKVSGYDRMTVFFDPEAYRVTKNQLIDSAKQGVTKDDLSSVEVDQNFLAVNPEKATYKIQILNVDLQKDQTVDIKIADKSGPPKVVKVSDISKNNINFEFGVE